MARIILENNDSNANDNAAVLNDEHISVKMENEVKEPVVDEFAAAFPEWNLVPPLQVIKRVRRGL